MHDESDSRLCKCVSLRVKDSAVEGNLLRTNEAGGKWQE